MDYTKEEKISKLKNAVKDVLKWSNSGASLLSVYQAHYVLSHQDEFMLTERICNVCGEMRDVERFNKICRTRCNTCYKNGGHAESRFDEEQLDIERELIEKIPKKNLYNKFIESTRDLVYQFTKESLDVKRVFKNEQEFLTSFSKYILNNPINRKEVHSILSINEQYDNLWIQSYVTSWICSKKQKILDIDDVIIEENPINPFIKYVNIKNIILTDDEKISLEKFLDEKFDELIKKKQEEKIIILTDEELKKMQKQKEEEQFKRKYNYWLFQLEELNSEIMKKNITFTKRIRYLILTIKKQKFSNKLTNSLIEYYQNFLKINEENENSIKKRKEEMTDEEKQKIEKERKMLKEDEEEKQKIIEEDNVSNINKFDNIENDLDD